MKQSFLLALASLTLGLNTFATVADLAGRYELSTNPDRKIIIDVKGRVKTNLAFANGANPASPITFAGVLKQDEFTDRWTVNGQTTFSYATNVGTLQCKFPVKMEAEFSTDNRTMDVTLTHAAQFGLDTLGRCVAVGQTSELLSFDRE